MSKFNLNDHRFLFSSLDSKGPPTTRKLHIRRLYDVLQLCIQRNDMPRAQRAWSILVRCKEIDWKQMWTTGLLLLGDDCDGLESNSERLEFLRAIMLHHPDERELVVKELVLRLGLAGNHREALNELELYLPSFPYHDNPVLHIYAGFLSLYLSQPSIRSQKDGATDNSLNPSLFKDAQNHFERAKSLDPDNVVAVAFLEKLPDVEQRFSISTFQPGLDSDEDSMEVDVNQSRKRVRI